MTKRTSQISKDRDRIDWLLRNPPHYENGAVAELLACCVSPPPATAIELSTFRVVDGALEQDSTLTSRADAMIARLTSGLNLFLIERALESEPSMGDTYRRLRMINDAADHLKRVLSMSLDQFGPQLPWPICRRFLQVMGHLDERLPDRGRIVDEDADQSSQYLGLAQLNQALLSEALTGLSRIHQWTSSAVRLEKSQLMRRRKQPDVALRRLIQAMSAVWTRVLGQELQVVSNSGRNVARWSPIPESYQHFLAFVRLALKPIAIEISTDDLRDAIANTSLAQSRVPRTLRRSEQARTRSDAIP